MAATAEAVQADYQSPSELVRAAVDESANTVDAAALLEQWAKANAELREYLTAPWLSRACYDAVGRATRDERASITKSWTAPNYTQGGNGHRVHAHAKSLLDFPLPGGMRLRDAKQKDLVEAARFYREQAEDMANKARWLDEIASAVGRRKVGSVFDDDTLPALN